MTVDVQLEGHWLRLSGDGNDDAGTLEKRLAELVSGPIELEVELAELELDDSAAILCFIDLLRSLAGRGIQLSLHHVPHLLAHSLYRVAQLGSGSGIRLKSMREEEPYG